MSNLVKSEKFNSLLEADIDIIKKTEKLKLYEKLGVSQLQELLTNIEKYKEEFERNYRSYVLSNQVRGASYMAQALTEIEKLRSSIIKLLLDLSNKEDHVPTGTVNITIGVPSKENAVVVEALDD